MAWYNWSQTATSNATADPAINWSEGQAPSSINDSARAMMAVTAEYRDDVNGSLTTSGSATAYTLATNSVYDTLAHLNGQKLTVAFHTTSGVTPTLNVDSLGAKPIRQASGITLPTGALLGLSVYNVTYNNSTGEFLIHDQPGVLAASSVNTQAIAASAVTYAKLQNETASTLLGNPTGSAAAPEEITLGAGLAFSGTTLIANPAAAQNYLSGLTLSTAGGSGTMSVAAGVANDSTNASFMTLAALSKTTASWAVGSGNGGIDTGSIANSTWYHFYVIERTDTGVVDVIFSLSASVPTLPTNYTLYRRIGSGKTDGSAHWLAFVQLGDQFLLSTPVADISSPALSTTPSLISLASVPTGIQVQALMRGALSIGTLGGAILINSPDEASGAVSGVSGNVTVGPPLTSFAFAFQPPSVRTNTSAQIRIVAASGSTYTLNMATYGWIDSRGK